MALAESHPRVMVRGNWPEPTTLRRGWSRAEARQWNAVHDEAHLRLVRGGSSFLEGCVGVLRALGASGVLSPPLPPSAQRVWRAAGFETALEMALMRIALDRAFRTPDHLVVSITLDDIEPMLAIDAAAFDPFWRFDEHSLFEAADATSRSELYAIRGPDADPVGYAVVGFGQAISYLQRVAVHPDWQGHGMGRSLLRAALRRARNAGASAMLLNTQFDNEPALALYESEGFVTVPEPLALLRAP